MRGKPETIDAHLATIQPDRRRPLENLRRAVARLVPAAEECISYGVPAFRVEGGVVAGFAATKDGYSYYPFSARTLAELGDEVAQYEGTKSSLHFSAKRPLPAALLRRLVRTRLAEIRGPSTSQKRPAGRSSFAAFLRGVSPTNAKMSELVGCFESAGLTDVKTVLSTGNVVFSAGRGSEAGLTQAIERAMMRRLGRTFLTFVRSIEELQALRDQDPFAALRPPTGAKRVVTFLGKGAKPASALPIERDGAKIWCVRGREAFASYTPTPQGPVFMQMIKRTFGEAQTTRTWDTILKVVKAGAQESGREARRSRRLG